MTLYRRIKNLRLLASAPIVVVLVFLLVSTDPFEAGPTTVLVFLSLVFILTFNIVYPMLGWARLAEGFNFAPSKTAAYYSGIIDSAGVIFLVGLKTLAQLQLADVLLVACFEILANFYVLRRL